MNADLYLLIVAIANVIGCGINLWLASRNYDAARLNVIQSQENAEIAERLVAIASKQGVVVLQRNR